MRSFLPVILFLLISSSLAVAERTTVRAIVSASNAPPYALFDESGSLSAGISKDILDELSKRSELNWQYLPLPRGRVEQWLLRDDADIACFLNPAWVEQPEQLLWSPALFTTQQVIVRRSTSPAIQNITDLFGKRLGTDRGFSYPELDAIFAQRLAVRDDASSLQINLSRLQKQRLDAVLTVDLAYLYHQQQYPSEGLQADPLWAEPANVYCALNQHQPELTARLLLTLQQMVADGTVANILQRYRQAEPSNQSTPVL
ncbi:hypothetical protein A9165_10150 [Alishewanella sp. HH-ZS]|nr:hypothetical protein A9165_10150 [Alishewanella sp. HH-ZS]